MMDFISEWLFWSAIAFVIIVNIGIWFFARYLDKIAGTARKRIIR